MDARVARKLLLILTLLLPTLGWAAQANLLLLQHGETQADAGAHATWLESPTTLDQADALALLLAGKGNNTSGDFPSFGLTRDSYWLLLRLDNQSNQIDWMLEAGRPHINRLDVYLFNSRLQPAGHWWSGSTRPLEQRPYAHEHLVFPLSLPPGKSYLLLRAHSTNVLDLPIALYTPNAFYQEDSQHALMNGLFFGATIILCLYNLLLFFSTRDRSYLTYVL